MADAVDTLVIVPQEAELHVVRLLNRSDGTGETNVVKVDKSTLVNVNGLEPDKLVIEQILSSIQGFTSVQFNFDHTTDDEAVILIPGNDYRNYGALGPGRAIKDPGSTGGTGDLLLTVYGPVSGATYDITLVIRMLS